MLEVGKSYYGIEEEQSFEIEKGDWVHFEKKEIQFRVLPKPKTVIADDTVQQEEVALPEHLRKSDWYAVLNLKTMRTHWLNVKGWRFNELPQ